MIETSTNATVELAGKIPAKTAAVVLLAKKASTPEGIDQITGADRSALDAMSAAKAFTGRAGEVASQVVNEPAPHRLLVVGLGPANKLNTQSLREAGAAVAKYARKHKLAALALIVPDVLEHGGPGETSLQTTIEALANGFLLGSFDFREFKGSVTSSREKDNGGNTPVRLTLVATNTGAQAKAALERARILSDAQNLARTVASRPGNIINPPSLAKVAQDLAKSVGLSCRVLDDKEIKRLGMGGLLAVGSGSPNPSRLIALEHSGTPTGKKRGTGALSSSSRNSPLMIVGKSITFDTGGISIKPADKMGDMIYDKSGGMAVLGIMYALAKNDYPHRVIGILSSAENHVSGTAYRPGDIITLYNGVTVEVNNTDAEGRLVLADAIAWGIDTYKPAAVVDLATLTGGVVVALGHTMAGLMSNDDELANEILAAAATAGEKMWRLPVGEDQRDMMKSNHADILNSAGRAGSPLTGAAFISFALPEKPKVPWAHLDIAGVADTDKELPLYAKGSTGYGVRTVFEWLTARAAAK